jgi:hypothetical protein
VWPQIDSAPPSEQISVTFVAADFDDHLPKNPNSATTGQKYRALSTKTHVLLIVAGDANRRKNNFMYPHTVESGRQLGNTHGMHCAVSTARMVTRTRHNFTLYPNFLFSYKQILIHCFALRHNRLLSEPLQSIGCYCPVIRLDVCAVKQTANNETRQNIYKSRYSLTELTASPLQETASQSRTWTQ